MKAHAQMKAHAHAGTSKPASLPHASAADPNEQYYSADSPAGNRPSCFCEKSLKNSPVKFTVISRTGFYIAQSTAQGHFLLQLTGD